MTDDKNGNNGLIIFGLVLIGFAFFAYLIRESNKGSNQELSKYSQYSTMQSHTIQSMETQQQSLQEKLDEIYRQQIIQQQKMDQIETALTKIPSIQIPPIQTSPIPTTLTGVPLDTRIRRQATVESMNNSRTDNPNIIRANIVRRKNTYNITEADEDRRMAKIFNMK